MHSKSQIKLEGANKNTASSKWKKQKGEMEVTCQEPSLLQMHVKVWHTFVTAQWSGQLMNGCPYLIEIEYTSPKPGSRTATGRLILETEAGTVRKDKDTTAAWPQNCLPVSVRNTVFQKNDALVCIAKIHSFSQIRPKLFLQQHFTGISVP